MRAALTRTSNVLVSGATGLIGGEIVRRLVSSGHTGRLWALIRGSDRGPTERMADRFRRSGDEPSSAVGAVAGDILQPDWGLAPRDRAEITDSVDVIVHNAADTSFAAHRDTATTNVAGVNHLIALARACRRPPLIVYMSTASNVGRASGQCLGEADGCRPGNEHFNDYTHSKAVGECALAASGLPVLTLRPSIVLSAGLTDPVFARQILWFAPLTRAFGALPIRPDARLDIVDVGFVADAALRLAGRATRAYDCYHLSAGAQRCVTVTELAGTVCDSQRRAGALRLVPPDQWTKTLHRQFVDTPLRRRVFRSLRHYLPFLNMDVVFDDARLRAEFPAPELPVRAPRDYLPDLLALIRERAALREACRP